MIGGAGQLGHFRVRIVARTVDHQHVAVQARGDERGFVRRLRKVGVARAHHHQHACLHVVEFRFARAPSTPTAWR